MYPHKSTVSYCATLTPRKYAQCSVNIQESAVPYFNTIHNLAKLSC